MTAYATLDDAESLTLDQRAILARLAARELTEMAERAAAAHQVTLYELVGRSHSRAAARARHAFWSELYDLGHWSYPRLAALFGKDHKTISYGVAIHRERHPTALRVVTVGASPAVCGGPEVSEHA